MRAAILAAAVIASSARAQSFSISQIKSYPFPNELTAAARGGRIAYALDEQGKRNIWVADAPAYTARRLTNYALDDGQELTSVTLTDDGRYVVYVRGGDHGSNWAGPPPNPLSLPTAPKVEIWSVPFDGGTPTRLGEGDDPVISSGNVGAFVRDRAIWTAPVDGKTAAKKLFSMNGDAGDPRWSPDGTRLSFGAGRVDHSLIGIFTNDSTPIRWIAPSTQRDFSPRWSPDGSHLVFVRTPGNGGAPDSLLVDHPTAWSIWRADARTGDAHQLWKSPFTLRGSLPGTQGSTNLLYGAGRIAFLSEMDGWPHLVVPRRVVFHASDGLEIHGQLFEADNASLARGGRKPAVIFVHGGPPRQMLLGWHYSDYYSNSYATNQYLASRGFVVLSVNYRLGIGYGRDFQHPANGGSRGASEYLDVLAGAQYLRSLREVDPSRLGIYGGSYGGFLTALALGRNSDLFAGGVDIHGVHDWTTERAASLLAPRYEKQPDLQRALDVAWTSSPVSSVKTWRSPALLIPGDDDSNVRFIQTLSLARRLQRKGVLLEEIVLPDDTHHMMRHTNFITVDSATAAWFERRFARSAAQAASGRVGSTSH